LGGFDDIEEIIDKYQVEEIVLAIDKEEDPFLTKILSVIERKNLRIKVSADVHDILLGSVKMDNIFGALLYEVNNDPMSTGQQLIKRVIDVFISIVSLILLTPLYLVLALLVKFSSEGPIFFRQERIGKNGKPFQIIKYRTMYVNAEDAGPQLSSEKDPRITKVGRVMRKLRLDEFPQFWNVLVGDMSLVGPRSERQFYIDQIATLEPQFLQLVKVRPGITSWGQVKFGYAENVEQMIQRMKFDLLYLNNRSLALDFKIMLHTILIIFKAKGK
jgi:exopolysaccharide biosynthesis polyprenyl glycosylphosphotransferase